jgi:hypothetical protein
VKEVKQEAGGGGSESEPLAKRKWRDRDAMPNTVGIILQSMVLERWMEMDEGAPVGRVDRTNDHQRGNRRKSEGSEGLV